MEDKANKYRVPAQKAFETVMIGAGPRIGGSEFVEIFDAAGRNAGWYAERENVPYRHLTLCETKPLRDWFQHWHENDYAALFRYWVCLNLERASYETALFTVTEQDAQNTARELALPPVTPDQMERVKAWVEESFDDWGDILATAVIESKKELEI